jgi:ABC-type Fe3+-hydroxamate transport system substrate-binding protein
VSLVPSQTELLFDLGLDQEVIAITSFCVHPAHWHRYKTRIGGTKRLHLDQIRSLQPDLIIANKEENDRAQVESLMADFPVWVSDIHDLDSALEMITQVGTLTDRAEKAQQICTQVKTTVTSLPQQNLKVAYFIWKDPWMVAGGDTFISAMLEQCGFENVFKNRDRYPEISLSELHQTDCQLVLLSSEPFPFNTTHFSAFPGHRVQLVDGEMFSWYGSRLLGIGAYIRENFY